MFNIVPLCYLLWPLDECDTYQIKVYLIIVGSFLAILLRIGFLVYKIKAKKSKKNLAFRTIL